MRDDIIKLAGHRQVPAWVVKLVGDAVAAEREACAQACETLERGVSGLSGFAFAAAIRARGQS